MTNRVGHDFTGNSYPKTLYAVERSQIIPARAVASNGRRFRATSGRKTIHAGRTGVASPGMHKCSSVTIAESELYLAIPIDESDNPVAPAAPAARRRSTPRAQSKIAASAASSGRKAVTRSNDPASRRSIPFSRLCSSSTNKTRLDMRFPPSTFQGYLVRRCSQTGVPFH